MKTVNGDVRLSTYRQKFNEELSMLNSTHAIKRQTTRLSKKMRFSDQELDNKALADFKILNESLIGRKPVIDAYILSNARLFITRALEKFTMQQTGEIQSTLDMALLMNLWRFGPGASNDVQGTHFAEKIQQPFSTTERCLPFARLIRDLNPLLYAYDSINGRKMKLTRGSVLRTVPKNEETARTIAIEPLANMAMQLAAGSYLEGALKCVGLDITKQADLNKKLARIGSVDGSLSTIDLKSCSDTILIELVELLLDSNDFYQLLMIIRSPCTEINGEEVELNMISTMGNGFTFPLMTMIFLSLYYGFLCKKEEIKSFYIDFSEFGVFGDDIVIPTTYFSEFCSVIEEAGFVINNDKSFSTGNFRESCGGDYEAGVEITPFYPKSLLTDTEVYVVINQQLEWQARERIFCPSSLEYLLSLLYDPSKPLLVPEWSDSTSGIRTSQVPNRYRLLVRQPDVKVAENNILSYLAVLGGYIRSARNGDLLFEPRPRRTRYKVERARLPKGWLSGRDPRYRKNEDTRWIDDSLSLLGIL